MAPPAQPKIYHIAHFDRLPSIIADGSLWCDRRCRSPIETSPASPIEMSRSSVCLRVVEVAWDDGDHDEPQRADPPTGVDRCR